MTNQIGDISDDGFWILTENGWQATEQQNQALAQGSTPYQSNEAQPANDSENIQMVNIISGESTHFSDRSVWIWRIAAGAVCFIGIIVFLILVLGPSAEEKELFGTWENEVDSLEFKENGDLNHQGNIYDGWSVSGSTIIFTDSNDPDYEWWHKYEIKGNILFIMPLDEDDKPIDGECIAMIREGYDFYEEYEKVTEPSWCTYE